MKNLPEVPPLVQKLGGATSDHLPRAYEVQFGEFKEPIKRAQWNMLKRETETAEERAKKRLPAFSLNPFNIAESDEDYAKRLQMQFGEIAEMTKAGNGIIALQEPDGLLFPREKGKLENLLLELNKDSKGRYKAVTTKPGDSSKPFVTIYDSSKYQFKSQKSIYPNSDKTNKNGEPRNTAMMCVFSHVDGPDKGKEFADINEHLDYPDGKKYSQEIGGMVEKQLYSCLEKGIPVISGGDLNNHNKAKEGGLRYRISDHTQTTSVECKNEDGKFNFNKYTIHHEGTNQAKNYDSMAAASPLGGVIKSIPGKVFQISEDKTTVSCVDSEQKPREHVMLPGMPWDTGRNIIVDCNKALESATSAEDKKQLAEYIGKVFVAKGVEGSLEEVAPNLRADLLQIAQEAGKSKEPLGLPPRAFLAGKGAGVDVPQPQVKAAASYFEAVNGDLKLGDEKVNKFDGKVVTPSNFVRQMNTPKDTTLERVEVKIEVNKEVKTEYRYRFKNKKDGSYLTINKDGKARSEFSDMEIMANPLPGSPLDLLQRGEVGYGALKASDISKWKKETRVFRSEKLSEGDAKAIMQGKAHLEGAKVDAHAKGPLLTFTTPSRVLIGSDGNALENPIDIVALNFTYPDFRDTKNLWKDGTLTTDAKDTLKEVLKVNILAVCAEAKGQGQALPFILNRPGAFLAGLSGAQKVHVAESIKEAFNDCLKDPKVAAEVGANVSEFIALDPNFWKQGQGKLNAGEVKVHEVNADIIDIAKNVHQASGGKAKCPVPIMGNPSHPIGCNALDITFPAFDEMLARMTGNTQGLTASVRHNPDLLGKIAVFGKAVDQNKQQQPSQKILQETGIFSGYGLSDGKSYYDVKQGSFAKSMLEQVGVDLHQSDSGNGNQVINPKVKPGSFGKDVEIAASEEEQKAFGAGKVTIPKEKLKECVKSVKVATALPTKFYVALQEKGLNLQDQRSAALILGIQEGADMAQLSKDYGFANQQQFEKFSKMTPVMMAPFITHSQQSYFFTEQKLENGKAVAQLKIGDITTNPATNFISASGINFAYGGFGSNGSPTAEEFIASGDARVAMDAMFQGVLEAAVRNEDTAISIPPIGLGAFIKEVPSAQQNQVAAQFFQSLSTLLQSKDYKGKFPDGVFFNMGKFTEDFQKSAEIPADSPLVLHGKDSQYLADNFAKSGVKCALVNASDPDVLWGVAAPGEYVMQGHIAAEEFMAAMSTATLGGKSMNPKAFKENVIQAKMPEMSKSAQQPAQQEVQQQNMAAQPTARRAQESEDPMQNIANLAQWMEKNGKSEEQISGLYGVRANMEVNNGVYSMKFETTGGRMDEYSPSTFNNVTFSIGRDGKPQVIKENSSRDIGFVGLMSGSFMAAHLDKGGPAHTYPTNPAKLVQKQPNIDADELRKFVDNLPVQEKDGKKFKSFTMENGVQIYQRISPPIPGIIPGRISVNLGLDENGKPKSGVYLDPDMNQFGNNVAAYKQKVDGMKFVPDLKSLESAKENQRPKVGVDELRKFCDGLPIQTDDKGNKFKKFELDGKQIYQAIGEDKKPGRISVNSGVDAKGNPTPGVYLDPDMKQFGNNVAADNQKVPGIKVLPDFKSLEAAKENQQPKPGFHLDPNDNNIAANPQKKAVKATHDVPVYEKEAAAGTEGFEAGFVANKLKEYYLKNGGAQKKTIMLKHAYPDSKFDFSISTNEQGDIEVKKHFKEGNKNSDKDSPIFLVTKEGVVHNAKEDFDLMKGKKAFFDAIICEKKELEAVHDGPKEVKGLGDELPKVDEQKPKAVFANLKGDKDLKKILQRLSDGGIKSGSAPVFSTAALAGKGANQQGR